MKILRKFFTGVSFAALNTLSGLTHAATLDLLVLYDDYTSNYYKGDVQTAMAAWVDQVNAAYRDSEMTVQLRLVGVH
jgi:hypothetical protein